MSDPSSKPKKAAVVATGLALSAAPACLLTVYTFAKNSSLDSLLYLFLSLIFAILVTLVISYIAYKKLGDMVNFFHLHTGPFIVTLCHFVILVGLGNLILDAFIHFKIAYGYILLPVTIDVVGAFTLIAIIRILRATHHQ
jgi:hypothetical protein